MFNSGHIIAISAVFLALGLAVEGVRGFGDCENTWLGVFKDLFRLALTIIGGIAAISLVMIA